MKRKKITALLLCGALIGMTAVGCGSQIKDDAVFATLDDTTITMGVANFCAKYEQAMYDPFYLSYFGEDYWDKDMYGNGNTMTEDVKSNIAEQLQNMYLLKAHMEEYNVTVSEEEEAAIQKAADDFIADNSSEAIKQVGAQNKENVIEMLRLRTIQAKMHKRIIEDADVKVTDKEAAQRTFSYVQINNQSHTDEESNQVDYTEEEKAELLASAKSIADAKDFDAAVTDAGYTVSTASYGSAKDESPTMDVAVLEAADKLKEGKVSDVVETDSAYYVLRLDKELDEEATKAKKESLISEKEEDYYNDILDGWKDEAKWKINESEWSKVNFDDHFKNPEEETETPSEETTGTDPQEEGATGADPADGADAGTESLGETETK